MSNENQIAVSAPARASDQLATFLGIEKGMMLDTLKAQCFKGKRPDEVSDAQLAAFVSTANALQVNPLLPGMLYAYPEKNGGVQPILGPDGTFKKLDEYISSGKLEGYDCIVYPEDVTQKPTHAIATIYRKGAKPATYTALFQEWVMSSSPVWQQKPRHMLFTRAIKQAARQVIHGLPMDEEEYKMAQMQNVTPDEPGANVRPPPKERSKKGAAAVRENDAVDVSATPVESAAQANPEPVKEAKPLARLSENENVAQSTAAKPAPAAPAAQEKVASFADAAKATDAAKEDELKVEQRALLRDGETVVVTASIDAFKVVVGKRDGKDHPYVTADIVSPELKGQVSQTDGGVVDGKPIAAWQLDNPVLMTVRGKKFKNGALINVVDKIQVMAPAEETEV